MFPGEAVPAGIGLCESAAAAPGPHAGSWGARGWGEGQHLPQEMWARDHHSVGSGGLGVPAPPAAQLCPAATSTPGPAWGCSELTAWGFRWAATAERRELCGDALTRATVPRCASSRQQGWTPGARRGHFAQNSLRKRVSEFVVDVLCSLPGNVRYKFIPSPRQGSDFVSLGKFRSVYGGACHNTATELHLEAQNTTQRGRKCFDCFKIQRGLKMCNNDLDELR